MGGTGKSTIAKTIAGKLDDSKEEEYPRILAGTYFCSRRSGDTRNLFNIIPTISHQLARRVRSYARALLDADVVDFATTTNPKLQIQKFLVEPWHKSFQCRTQLKSSYLIIIDALDELENKGGAAFLEELLATVKDGQLQGLKFLVTSRPDPQLVQRWEPFSQGKIFRIEEVSRNEVERDIETFLRHELPALKHDHRIKVTAQRANGIFIYAATVVRILNPRELSLPEQETQLTDILEKWPSNNDGNTIEIDDLYKEVIQSNLQRLGKHRATRLEILYALLSRYQSPHSPIFLIKRKLQSNSSLTHSMSMPFSLWLPERLHLLVPHHVPRLFFRLRARSYHYRLLKCTFKCVLSPGIHSCIPH